MKEEKLKARYGTKFPFRTPDDYFESLTDRIMAQIPANEVAMTPRRKRKTWLYVAAICCLLLMCGVMASKYTETGSTFQSTEVAQQDNETGSNYVEDMVGYALISDAMVYYEYISDEE